MSDALAFVIAQAFGMHVPGEGIAACLKAFTQRFEAIAASAAIE